MAVGYKEYGTCPKVWMIVCVNSGGSPTEGAAKEGLFFLFLNMPAGKNQKQGSPPPRFAQGPEAFQDFATRLAKTAWLLFLCALGCVCCGKRGLAYRCLQCLGHMHIEVGLVECKTDVKKNIILLSHRSCPLLADHHKKNYQQRFDTGVHNDLHHDPTPLSFHRLSWRCWEEAAFRGRDLPLNTL